MLWDYKVRLIKYVYIENGKVLSKHPVHKRFSSSSKFPQKGNNISEVRVHT